MNTNPRLSAMSCGCDPAIDHLCSDHTIEKLTNELASCTRALLDLAAFVQSLVALRPLPSE